MLEELRDLDSMEESIPVCDNSKNLLYQILFYNLPNIRELAILLTKDILVCNHRMRHARCAFTTKWIRVYYASSFAIIFHYITVLKMYITYKLPVE